MLHYQTISQSSGDEALAFAQQELRRYLQAVTGLSLQPADNGDVTLTVDPALDEAHDEYAVDAREETLRIRGANTRAVLYGVYAFCEKVLGVRFLHPGFEWVPACPPASLRPAAFSSKALFTVRAYGMDGANSLTYGVDMLAKLGYNTFSVSASGWDAHKDVLEPELAKRGMKLSLSGHDLAFYLPPSAYFDAHPDWFALRDGERTPDQLCFSNEEFIEELARRIGEFCRTVPRLDSLVLMFNDNAAMCGCDDCRETGFLASYLRMIDQVQERLRAQGLTVKLFHIAYNAALAWDMLEHVPETDEANGMVACWGRNYAYAVPDARGEQDERFKTIFERWGELLRREDRDYRVFEYYGDCWMMGTMLPPLGRVIEKDIPFFHAIGVTGVDELEFSIPGELDTLRMITPDLYDTPQPVHYEVDTIRQITWHNHYMLGKSMWEDAPSYGELLADYAAGAFGAAAPQAAALLQTAETALAPLSRFSSSMFKLRITDAWLRDDFSAKGTYKTRLRRWSPEHASRTVTEEAAASCGLAHEQLAQMEPVLGQAQALQSELTDGQRENLADFLRCMRYFLDKTASLEHQYRAQLDIEDGRPEAAKTHLQAALALEESFDGMETENCAAWLRRLEEV